MRRTDRRGTRTDTYGDCPIFPPAVLLPGLQAVPASLSGRLCGIPTKDGIPATQSSSRSYMFTPTVVRQAAHGSLRAHVPRIVLPSSLLSFWPGHHRRAPMQRMCVGRKCQSCLLRSSENRPFSSTVEFKLGGNFDKQIIPYKLKSLSFPCSFPLFHQEFF